MSGALTLGSLIMELRRSRGLSQQALAAVVGLSPTTVAKLERGRGVRMHAENARHVLLTLGAVAPLRDEQCARFIELAQISMGSKDGVLSDADREHWTHAGVLDDPDDPDAKLRPTRDAVRIYGAKVARALDVGMDRIARAKPPVDREMTTPSLLLAAHRMLDTIAAHGGILAAVAALMPLEEDALAGRRVGAPRELNAPNPVTGRLGDPPPSTTAPPIVPASHTLHPGGVVTTVYKPEDQQATPPATPPAPKPQAQPKRKSG